jgi:serine/threonine protein kinase
MAKRLTVVAGPDEGRSFPLTQDTLLLGRSRATDTHFIDPHISRVHGEIKHDRDQFVLTDLESPGGTFVNGKRVNQHILQPGDLIRIGTTHLQFEEAQPAKPAAAASKGRRAAGWAQALVGQTLGHYKVGPILARGKSGFVFHGQHAKRKVPVALKVLDPAFSQDLKAMQRFVRAMKTELPLRHPHLVRVYAAGKTGTYCWVAKEYVPGESLAAAIGRVEVAGHLDWRRVAHVAFYLGQALRYVHQRKMVHRNVTPQNILLGASLKITKLSDVMLASALEEDPTRPISAAGVPSESLAYMSPERTDGPAAAVGAQTDVYSLGGTLYAMLAGRPPFQGSTVRELVQRIRLQAPPTFKSLGVNVPGELEAIIQRMLAKRPHDRFPSMHDFLRHLRHFAKHQTEGETTKA